jgi:hypothetical protein
MEFDSIGASFKPKLGDIKVYKLRNDKINSQQNSSSGSGEAKQTSLFNTMSMPNDPFLHVLKILNIESKW